MKLWWSFLLACVALPLLLAKADDGQSNEADLWNDDDDNREILHVREARNAKDRSASGGGGGGGGNSPGCRYTKGQWSECDPKTNMRSRSLSLKRGDKTCEQTKTITKKCKKACRYEKGSWSSCVNQQTERVDNLKANSDPTCAKTRRTAKRCKPEMMNAKKAVKERPNKKGNKQQ